MLGDVYLATALAIFLAIFGWSESIFGMSQKTKEKEADFITKTNLTPQKYRNLRRLVANYNKIDAGIYLKELMKILKNTNLVVGQKQIFDKIGENEKKIKEWKGYIKTKKIFFTWLFIFLFLAGTTILILEIGNYTNLTVIIDNISIPLYVSLSIIFQLILFIMILFGFSIYKKIDSCESYVQNKLNEMLEEGV